MPTTTTPSTELAKLEKARDKAHAPVRELKRKRRNWDTETEARRYQLTARRHAHPAEFEGAGKPKQGTEAAKLELEIKKRMAEPNPFQADFDAAVAEFHARDTEVEQFKLHHVRDRLGEVETSARRSVEDIVEAAEALRVALDSYRGDIEEARAVLIDTPGLDARYLGHEPRIGEWTRVASDIVETEILLPGLTPTGEQKVDEHAA
jgi:hypothetical protein